MSKFPNHYILKLFQKFRENFFQSFLSQNWPLLYDYFPDIHLEFLIAQLFLNLSPKYRKNFLKIACFKSFLKVPLNFLRISKHMSISSEFGNTYKFTRNLWILLSSKWQSTRWKTPALPIKKNTRMSKFIFKSMLIDFFLHQWHRDDWNYSQCYEKFYPIFSRHCASQNLPEVCF